MLNMEVMQAKYKNESSLKRIQHSEELQKQVYHHSWISHIIFLSVTAAQTSSAP